MDVLAGIVAVCVLGFLIVLAAREPRAPDGNGRVPAHAEPVRVRPPDHVHTYARTSTEETAGEVVDIWRCAGCGDIVRWVRR
jgi:hypothetical protein